ncbi:YkyB-like protein [Gracilibacillus ureilyticus]|uniref:YkyB-like protein n=1 Tax=Gracilibacillus ureilyticus TaxID=531814 RepID=A0A1H9TLM9_9BACI|nr:YkyB family protein [Gracilibacillus ureilyticus]SER98051.1 YkyB-like protein [Gracilibacillus ureilyticus]
MTDNTQLIGQALFIVNRHAKTAPDPSYLYKLKKATMEQLLMERKAEKVGLHFSNNPKHSRQHSVMLVKVGNYFFHMPPTKEDMKGLKHLGKLDNNYRNPIPNLSLSKAKKILTEYLKWTERPAKIKRNRNSPPLTSSYLHPASISPFYHKRKK